jgi:hypothetical protein
MEPKMLVLVLNEVETDWLKLTDAEADSLAETDWLELTEIDWLLLTDSEADSLAETD